MTYSQKYSLVHFIKSIQTGTEFHMSEWPLHTTLADVFALKVQESDIKNALAASFEKYPSVCTTALQDSTLGSTDVVLLEKTPELVRLHEAVVTLLEERGSVFNNPEFTRDGFIPHSTIQLSGRLQLGEEVTIDTLSLVDMFPDNDWEQRKILFTIQF